MTPIKNTRPTGARYPVGAGVYHAHQMRESRFSLVPPEGCVPLYLLFQADISLPSGAQQSDLAPLETYLRKRGASPQMRPNVLQMPRGTMEQRAEFLSNWTGGWLLLVAIPDARKEHNRVMRQAQKYGLSGRRVAADNERLLQDMAASAAAPAKKKKGGATTL